jgi:hypothetical protein
MIQFEIVHAVVPKRACDLRSSVPSQARQRAARSDSV